MSTKQVIRSLGYLAFVIGIFFGLKPVTDYEITPGSLGDKVDCGSAWSPAKETLTTFGRASCARSGIESNRTISIVATVSGLGLVLSTINVGRRVHDPSPSVQAPVAVGGVATDPNNPTDPSVAGTDSQVPCHFCWVPLAPGERACQHCGTRAGPR